MEVIPAIDLIEGGVVRLYKGDFDQVTQYDDAPLAVARRYLEAGLTRLHAVDLVTFQVSRHVRTFRQAATDIYQLPGGYRNFPGLFHRDLVNRNRQLNFLISPCYDESIVFQHQKQDNTAEVWRRSTTPAVSCKGSSSFSLLTVNFM